MGAVVECQRGWGLVGVWAAVVPRWGRLDEQWVVGRGVGAVRAGVGWGATIPRTMWVARSNGLGRGRIGSGW